ncbi:MAG: WD40 repeat protein, partial [Planctomycetota bacterium]
DGGFSIKSVSNVESGLILCADIRTSNPRRTIHHGAIYTWNPLTEDLPKKIGADLPGQLMESVVKETADQLALLLRFKRGDETALLAFQLSFDLKTLKPRSLASPFAKEKVSIRNHLAPQIDVNFCSVFFDGHRDSRFVYDFSTGRFYELQLEDKEQLAAYVRVEKRPQALIWRRDDDRQTGSCYLHDLTAEKPKQTIFEAHKLKMVIFMDESKQFVAWDENEQMIGVRELNGLERWIPIPMPLGHKQRTYEINVHDQNHIVLVDHDSQVTLIDLRPEMAFPVHVFQTSDFQRFLAIEDLPGGAIKTTVLSHHGSAFSHFKNLKPEAKRLEASSTKSWSVQNLPIWSLIDTDGVDLTLAINKDTESARLRRSVGKVAVIPPVTVGRAGNDPQDAIIEAVDSFVHYGTYEDKRIIDVKSSLHWQIPDGQKGLHLVKHKDRVAFLTNIGDSLVLTQLPTKEFLWKIDIKDKMESNEITTVVSDSKHIYLCELSPPSVFEPKRDFARIRLTRQAVSTGEILDQWIWNTSEEEAKRLSSSWGRKLHIILSPNPSVILDTATDDGMRVLLNTNEGKLVEQLRWLGGREPLHILNGNESFTVDLSTSDTQKKMLGIFRFKGDKWERQEIALSAPLKKFYPAPNGKRALIATERGLQLWDLESNQAIGTTLEGPNIFLQGSAPNVVWSPPGDSLFIWDDWRINQYDTESGKYLQTHKEHTRDDTQFRTENPPKICLVTLSPDGKWLVSGDAQGTMIRSNLSPRNISAKALRAAALAIGGMEVTEDGQLQNWQPTR